MLKRIVILSVLSFVYVISSGEMNNAKAQKNPQPDSLESYTLKYGYNQKEFSDEKTLQTFIESRNFAKLHNVTLHTSNTFTDLVCKRFSDSTYVIIKLGHIKGKNAQNGYARIIRANNLSYPNWYKNRLSYKVAENTEKAQNLEGGNYTLIFGKNSDKVVTFNLKQFVQNGVGHTIFNSGSGSLADRQTDSKVTQKQEFKSNGVNFTRTAGGKNSPHYYREISAPDIKGAYRVFKDSVARYFIYESAKNYIWRVKNGTLLEDNGDTILVKWPSSGYGKVEAKVTSEFGESGFTDFGVTVMRKKEPQKGERLINTNETKLEIQKLEKCPSCYPNSELYVFYPNGTIAYHEENYQNNWKGEGLNNKSLPSGIYYYNLDLKGDGSKSMEGYIRLKQ